MEGHKGIIVPFNMKNRLCHWCGTEIKDCDDTQPFVRCNKTVNCQDRCLELGKHWPPLDCEYSVPIGVVKFNE